jgi:hypothetical protein
LEDDIVIGEEKLGMTLTELIAFGSGARAQVRGTAGRQTGIGALIVIRRLE